ncbi:peptidoglycan DD-metalloendopeptidase family protein [Butyrivibrio sp. INlla16]|uniref:peptidoglycan DD-metalloendopeptidase family protein n=1 Tax=Butyrivibrio sp. INlla16 TaxID=1520807 RepID=UPI00088D9E83|nr:peptidoglycan DD-metalloendopeptidase family protein [Butyrivibrio sp. INlla16]SDB06953.1 Peptidase family M23 [Butyrivibrio sp. INlla16]
MADINKPKKHRHKRHYTFMIISGDSDGSSGSFHVGHVAAQVLAFSIFAIFLFLICYVIHSAITLSSLKKYTVQQSAQIEELDTANKELIQKNSELENEVSQLSQALNQKVEAEAQTAAEEQQQYIPSLLPISGTASIENSYDDPNSTEIELQADGGEENADEEGAEGEDAEKTPVDTTGLDPILILTTEANSTIIASGSGTVTSVTADVKYGNSVTIDHGNGYITIYRNAGESLVHEGDSVAKGATLFVVGENNTKLGYQIKQDGVFVNPEEMVEING